jgi:hypothetical protein
MPLPRSLFALPLALAACHGVGATSAAIDQACTDVAQARCQKRATCSNNVSITRTYGDMPTCLEREKLSCENGLAAPDSGNSASRTEACAASYAGISCADFLAGAASPECVFVGSRPNGSPCAFNGQCQSSYCIGTRDARCGTCGAPPADGASCATSFCVRGQICESATNLCQTPGKAGDPCDAGHTCYSDLSCVGSTATTMGVCQTNAATVGAACDTHTPCDGTVGLHCQSSSGMKTCVATMYVGDGMPCGTVGGTFVSCGAAGSCYTSTGIAGSGEAGTCKAAAADGAACDTVVGPPCLSPARCMTSGGTSGTCAAPDAKVCG